MKSKVVIIFFILSSFISVLLSNSYTVFWGDDPSNINTLQHIIDDALTHNANIINVYIKPGLYKSVSVKIDFDNMYPKTVILSGYGGTVTFKNEKGGQNFINVTASDQRYIRLNNLNITNYNEAIYADGVNVAIESCNIYKNKHGIKIFENNLLMKGSKIEDNVFSGIRGFYSSVILFHSKIKNNNDGVYLTQGFIEAYGSTIANNKKNGVILVNKSNNPSLLDHCLLHNNGVAIDIIKGYINHCTIVYNEIGVASASKIDNSIIYFNNKQVDCAPIILYSDIEKGYQGQGNIDKNPQFVPNSNFQLQDTSPCIDAADPNSSTFNPQADPDGTRRDMGYQYKLQIRESCMTKKTVITGAYPQILFQ